MSDIPPDHVEPVSLDSPDPTVMLNSRVKVRFNAATMGWVVGEVATLKRSLEVSALIRNGILTELGNDDNGK